MTRVLAVDDSEQNLLLLQLQLRNRGFTLELARHGIEALELARQTPPDLVISDLLMPLMDGYTLLRHWRADPRLAAVPFIVYTATYTDARDERLARELGADGFVVKPVEPAVLLRAIDAALAVERSATAIALPPPDRDTVMRSYSEVLVAKLEDKAQALEHTNRELRAAQARARDLAQQLVASREEESARIARELHDELGQALTGLKLDLGWVQRRLERLGEPATLEAVQRRVQAMSAAIDATVTTTRRICTELRPAVLDDLGLAAAIEWQAREFGERAQVAIVLDVPTEPIAIEAADATTLFRICQELLTNIARHAAARQVIVRLLAGPDQVQLEISDDGRGFDPDRAASGRGLGLVGIRERARQRGGRVAVASAADCGTTVTVALPLGQQPPAR